MKIIKFIVSWQFLVSITLAVLIFYILLKTTFWRIDSYTNHGVQVEVPNLEKTSLNEAMTKLDESSLEYEIDTSKYDPKYKPYQILDVYPLAGSNVKKGRRIFIRANARTWKPVAVPNIIGRYKYLGFNQLDLVGLKVQDTIYEPSLAVNTILKLLYRGKEVQPGITLPRFSALTVVLGKGFAKNVTVPSFIGLDEVTAQKMITENLFSIGSVNYDDPTNKENVRVYYQVPNSSSSYDQGQPIDLYLSSKPLEELKEKIKELDATFNRNYINSIENNPYSEGTNGIHNEEGTTVPKPESNTNEPAPISNTPSNVGTSTPKPKPAENNTTKPTPKPKPEEPKPTKPNRVIIE